MHHDRAVAPDEPKKKPDIVRFYNATKGGVDIMDQMAHACTTKRKTKRWPMVLFYNCLDLGTVAARVIWQLKFPEDPLSQDDTRTGFIVRVAEQLALPHLKRRAKMPFLSKPLRATVTRVMQNLVQKEGRLLPQPRCGGRTRKRPASHEADQAPSAKKQGRCGSCDWKKDRKSSKSCFSCGDWLCKEHALYVCKTCSECFC